MFDYMTVQETAKLWNLSERRVQKLCENNRIEGVVRLSRVWLIPKNAKKPIDKRYKATTEGNNGLQCKITATQKAK